MMRQNETPEYQDYEKDDPLVRFAFPVEDLDYEEDDYWNSFESNGGSPDGHRNEPGRRSRGR